MDLQNSKIAIRRAGAADCAVIYRLICTLEDETLPQARFEAVFARQLAEADRYVCLLGEQGGQTVGVINLRFEEQLHHAARIAEIMEFVVEEKHRGRGIGRLLLCAACRCAIGFGCTQLEVACSRHRTEAHRFYQSAGMCDSHQKFVLTLTEGNILLPDTGE